jgi:hypothetical protein
VRVSFVRIDGPVFCVRVDEPGAGESLRECWPTTVSHPFDGELLQMRFAWDRTHRVLYVDDRWPLLAKRPRPECEETAVRLARRVLREAAERASSG